MTLEFTNLVRQVQKLGSMLNIVDFDLGSQLDVARERFATANDIDFIRDHIRIVRQSDVSGYRGAAPLDAPHTEPVNFVYPPPEAPPHAILMAADGSQIYPDEQAPVHYYLLNTGIFIYYHGAEATPTQMTIPQLYFQKEHVHDRANRVISNRTVDARRTVNEMKQLAAHAWELRKQDPGSNIVSLYDNHLLFWANSDVTGSDQIMRDYHAALVQLHDTGAVLAGYLDNPFRSRVVMRLLYLLSLRDEAEIKQKQQELARGGDLEGLRDAHLFQSILQPGERSAMMVQNSPRNLSYKQRGISYEIAFFYVKVYNSVRTAIARVDLPMWVARDKETVDALHALILEQCKIQGHTPYPYALTRADELAFVSGKDKRKLDELVNIELRKKGIEPRYGSAKDLSKIAARSDQRPYELRTDLR